MRATSGYLGETIVDPETILAHELKRRGVIDVAISDHAGYPNGMMQPAVLIGGKNRLWYRWAIVPGTVSLCCFRALRGTTALRGMIDADANAISDEFRRRKGPAVTE